MGSKRKFLKLEDLPSNWCFLLSPSNSYQDRKMKTRGWSPTEFVWRLYQYFFAKNGSKDQRIAMFPYKMDTLYQSLFSSHTDPNNTTTFYFLYRLYCDPHQSAMNERLQAHFKAPCNNIYIDEDPIRASWKIVRIRNWILSTKKDISTTTLNLTPSPPGFANIFYNKLMQ